MTSALVRRRHSQSGSLLITAAVASAIVAILIGGMLTYISNEYRLNVHSHRWTQALHLAEAGVEVGFAEFNNFVGSNAFTSARGWEYDGSCNCYIRQKRFQDATLTTVGTLESRVYNVAGNNPKIEGFGTVTGIPGGTMIRKVESRLTNSARFPAGMVAKNKIDMNGNNIYTDSFDSWDVSKSTNSKYDSAKKQANGDVASNDTITNTVDVSIGNANIYGSVLASPNGTVTMGPNGSVGNTFDTSKRATTVSAAQSAGYVRNDFAVDIPDVTLPGGATSWSSMGNINDTTTINGGSWRASGISLSGQKTLTVYNDVTLYVTGDISLSGQAQIIVAPGATLTVYSGGNVTISGQGVANNSTSDMNLQFYGLNSSTSWTLSGNGIWNGLVYAPYAAVTLNGGGANGDMSGAVIAKSITLNGHVQFHYDEALRTHGPNASYDIASWKSYRYNPSAGWVAEN
jgi:hypothetical protein